MLEKLYGNLSKKDLKNALKIYYALITLSFIFPILYIIISYFTNNKITFSYSLIVILIILFWSLFNVKNLKKITRNN